MQIEKKCLKINLKNTQKKDILQFVELTNYGFDTWTNMVIEQNLMRALKEPEVKCHRNFQ